MFQKMPAKQYAGVWLLIIGLSGAMQSLADTQTKPEPARDAALEAALNADGNGEGVQIQGIIQHELDPGVSGAERAVVWMVIGPTYWVTMLSVVAQQNGQWTLLASVNLEGAEAKLEAVTPDRLIILDAKMPGPHDPICCPSQSKKLKYQYGRGKLVEITSGATQ